MNIQKNINKLALLTVRNAVWFVPLLLGLIYFPQTAFLETLLMIVLFEALAIGLTSISAYLLSRSETLRYQMWNALGSIFLGVHICIGLIVVGVYFTQI